MTDDPGTTDQPAPGSTDAGSTGAGSTHADGTDAGTDGSAAADRVHQKNLDRLTALSDGIFAIAMTLLVLDIHVTENLDTADFRHMLHELMPKVGAYALSFGILAGIWRDHRRVLREARRVEGPALWLALVGLGAIALVPFPTTMLAEYASQPLAVTVYATTIIVINIVQVGAYLTLKRQGNLVVAPPDTGTARMPVLGLVTDLSSTALVFAVTVPIAFAVSAKAAIWCWLAMVPVKLLLGRRERAKAKRAAVEPSS